MIRLGLVGVNTSHADAFSRLINGTPGQPSIVDGATIAAVWGGQPERVAEIAATYRIPSTVSELAEMRRHVDGVLIVDDTDGGALHAELARPFLEAGVPVFIDKPMATSVAEAEALFDIAARRHAPLMSCSALRFAAELEIARPAIERIGTLSSVISTGPGDWYYYGVHAVELLGTIVGTGARSVHRHAFPTRDVAVVAYDDGGPTAIVQTLRDAAYVFELIAYGEHGHHAFQVTDANAFYGNTMRAVVRMIETGTPPVPADQTLEVLRILAAGNASAASGTAVPVTQAGSSAPAG